MAVTKEYAVFFSLFPNNNKGVNVCKKKKKKKEEDCFWIIKYYASFERPLISINLASKETDFLVQVIRKSFKAFL